MITPLDRGSRIRALLVLLECQGCCRPESRDERHGERAWPESTLLTAAVHQRRQRRALVAAASRDQCADALRA